VRERRERITIHAAPSERAEAEFVVITIEQAIGGSSFFAIDSPHRWAGSGALLRRFRRPLPHRRAGRRSVRSARAFRDSVPQAFACPAGAGAIGRRPARSVCGDGRGRHRSRDTTAAERAAVERALELLLPLVERCGGDPARFLDAVGLASDADFWDERAEGVALLTLHAAKGLEFACVFIVGLEDGVLPLHWGRAEEVAAEELAEERRLFYVGMTRAKDRLVLSHALKRLWRGRVHAQAPSPFLADIESELVKEQRSKLRRGREDRQLKLL
jgi:DNA helicase-2/ATP-dependent DNA helicase PcrA